MGYSVQWYVPDQVLYVEADEVLTLDDLRSGNDQIIDYFNASTAPAVHLLVDNSRLKKYPTDLSAIISATKLLRHPRCGWTVTYDQSNNRVIEAISSLMYRVFNKRRYSASDVQQALDFMRRRLLNIDWQAADESVLHPPAHTE